MRIKDYYRQILKLCTDTPLIVDFHLDFEEIDADTGYLSGILDLVDGSNLHIAEFVVTKNDQIKREKYRFHWQDSNSNLIARWDNVKHHKEIKSYPHHLHKTDKVLDSEEMDLFKVIKEIEKSIS